MVKQISQTSQQWVKRVTQRWLTKPWVARAVTWLRLWVGECRCVGNGHGCDSNPRH